MAKIVTINGVGDIDLDKIAKLLPGRKGERGGCRNSSGRGRDDSLIVASTTSVSLRIGE